MNRSTSSSSTGGTPTLTLLLSVMIVLASAAVVQSAMFVQGKPLRRYQRNKNDDNDDGRSSELGDYGYASERLRTRRFRFPSASSSFLWNMVSGIDVEEGTTTGDDANTAGGFITTTATLRERDDETAEFFLALNNIGTNSMPSSATMSPSEAPSVNTSPSNGPSLRSSPSNFPSNEPSVKTTLPSEVPSISSIPSDTGLPTSASPSLPSTTVPTKNPIASTTSPTLPPSDGPTSIPSTNPTVTVSDESSLFPTLDGCKMTPDQRKLQILALLDSVADSSLIRDPTSPQGAATWWIINEDEFQVCPDDGKCGFLQRWVLAVFYYSTFGDNWVTISGTRAPFLGDADECNWFGITCIAVGEEECVERIVFEANNLSGTIPSELALLPELVALGMEQGTTSSTIPTEIGKLEKMIFIDLDFNSLSGTIPTQLYQLTNLRTLDLNVNELTGDIDTRIGALTDLEFIQLQDNFFTGNIPTEIGLLTNLETFNVHANFFTGAMPQEVCDLTDNPFDLSSLIADCECSPEQGGVPPFFVPCTCCSGCACGRKSF